MGRAPDPEVQRGLRRKADALGDLRRRQRPCRDCGMPISIVTAFDLRRKVERTLVIDPTKENPKGWLVVNDEGAFIDESLEMPGRRWFRHTCMQREPRRPLTRSEHDEEVRARAQLEYELNRREAWIEREEADLDERADYLA